MILIFSHPDDPHAARVLELLRSEGHHALLLNFADFPARARFSVVYDPGFSALPFCMDGEAPVDLKNAQSAWWRRPQIPDLSGIRDGPAQAFTHNEWNEAINGIYQLIEAPWMNPPARDEVAGRKLYQLKVAAECGLRIPRTLATTDPEAARRFLEKQDSGKTIYKTFSCTHEVWRETRLVTETERGLLQHLPLAPVIFQEYISGDADLRVTIVGNRIFPAAIHAQGTSYPVDFRMSLGEARTEVAELPTEITEMLFAFMRRMGLVYGAIDLRRTPEGEHVFLEVNTAGEFLFIEERTGQPITRAIADWLITPS